MIHMAWVALAALILVTSDASAQTRLRMANWLPPSHPLVAEIMVPWSKAVEEATQGRVSIEIMQAPLGPPPAHFDFAVNGIADITYGVHNYTPGRFPTTELAELPFLSDSARDLSVAYWRIYDRYLKAANEQRGVQVLGVFVHGPGQLYTTERAIGSIEDLRGLKIRIGGGVAQEVAKAIGVVPIQAPVTQAYEILSQGVADGIQFPAESIGFFNLQDVVRHGVLFPGGLYTVSFFVAMNQARWSALADADRQAIASVSGERLARLAGEAWDRADARGRQQMKAAGVVEKPASGDLLAAIRADVQPVIDQTLERIQAKGVDARAAYEALKREVAAVRAGS